MLSRVADSIYWMSRYVERAESVARFIDVNYQLMLDLPTVGGAQQWEPLVVITGDFAEFRKLYAASSEQSVIRFLTFDRRNPNSIISCLRGARENARSIREIISSEMWEQLNTFYLMVTQTAAATSEADEVSYEFFTSVKQASHLFLGITDATLTHNAGWHFHRLGRMIERADKTSRILDVKYFLLSPEEAGNPAPVDDLQWSALLRSASAFEMFRKAHGRVTPERVVSFLLLDQEFPRAIRYSLIRAQQSLHIVSGTPLGTFSSAAEQLLGQLRAELDYAQVQDILAAGLHDFLDLLQHRLNRIGDSICETLFGLRPAAHATQAQSQNLPG